MRYRQIHLDFHTSEKIPGVGKDFSKEQFQEMLKKGHVDSITVFSKCHHGWSYHPTKVNEMHPELGFDLLKAQIEAAHEIDVKTPVYISAGFDEKSAVVHPEWLAWSPNSYEAGEVDFSTPRYHKLCLNSAYLDKLLGEIREVCENYDADGIFLDIVSVYPCYCENCKKSMAEKGLDINEPKDVLRLAEEVYDNYTRRVRETIDAVKPGLPVFHNGGHIRHGRRDLAHMDTHLELESLPTGGWGYDHFPMSAAYVRTIGMDYLGMTGKFHKTWGEFGGYKHPNALRYEVALSAANGAKCSIGDQLHPSGLMDNATYSLIGEAYKTIEEREPWLKDARNRSDIAILSNEAIANYFNLEASRVPGSNAGCARILLESHYLFDVVDTEADLSGYKLVILPDHCILDAALTEKINGYLAQGGKLLASYQSGMDPDKTDFAIDLGVRYEGMSEYNPTYIRPEGDLPSLRNAAYIIYEDSTKVTATAGKVTAIVEKPYFNRTIEHFCSHKHAPASGEKYSDAVVINGNTAYLSQRLFHEYYQQGNIYTKQIVREVIQELLGDEISVRTDLPAQGILTLTEQGNKQMVHTLYASPVRRGDKIEVIEDIIPLYNTAVSLRSDRAPKAVTLVPEGTPLPYTYTNGRIEFTIPKIDCWQITEIEY
ncbi:MAG: beta-galactosidase trimerization domain-containing protein [Clostridia bacterium]|nr:beta-galactosidase trimerization domain-containing protein [Clostridia bacterium]